MAASRPTIAPDEDIAALLESGRKFLRPSQIRMSAASRRRSRRAAARWPAAMVLRASARAAASVQALPRAAEGGIGGGTEVSSLDPLVPALPTSGDGTIDAAREDEEEWAAAAAAYRQVCPVRREVAVFEEYRRQAAAEGRAAAEAAAEAEMEEEEPETGSGEAAALAAPLRGLASAPGCAGTTDRVTSFSDTLRPACSATTASSSSSAAFIHAYRPPDPLSVGPCGVICARGYATIWPAGYDEPCLLDGAAIRLLASAMATVRAYEDIEARRGRDGGDVRDVRCCRDVRSWAEVCAAAREREFKILARDSAALAQRTGKRLKEKARKGRRAAEAAGEPEVAPSPAPPPVFKTLREKKAAQASAEGWAAEVARAEELYEELRERAPQHCRRGGKWAREKFVMAVQGEFPRPRGAGVPKGTVLCLGRVLDAHDEQDDAEGGHRDWEEDPLGFDTNPMLLRAMCMAFE
ncbi:hypothetical protein EMIHUDRAFT_211327 [Emiliania huxleyi CCMP1516]|uniref:Uncharacterized protein n=2 Tax=Emiliania huxleyi TaxID=2903 RepID=A0A0D3IWT3_EMIH1|nr:hypothetical protein EMIHUDRAFT_211327 [Emiliania huxleyi CCMP1516]EOD15718.1 hypothetical protein EMIHUDRAFT_211327 [Emiliania huxleyi CCMP1516]|eukprot:XP_005768147.1 hypothetical protein EMIHUDRAFT_211327 [Emiliania huxleyi CCMP1516]